MNKSIILQIFSGSKSNQIQSQDYINIPKFGSNDSQTLLKEMSKNQDKNEESGKVQFSVQYSVFENEIEKDSTENLGQGNKLAYPNPIKQIRIPFDKVQFILQPIINEGILQCQIRKIRFSNQNSKYEMSIFDYPMLTAEQVDAKQKKKIIFKSSGINYFAGKLKWDKYGQNFIFLDNKINPKKCSTISMHRLCIGGANYQKNGLKKPHKIRVYLPEITQSNQMFEYRQQKFQYFESKPKNFQEFQNREAEYCPEAKMFVLPFYNRALIASSKNLQLCQKDNNKVFFLLGKIDKGLYNLDFQWPISPLQAFQIAMSCFVSRATD